MSIEHFFPTAVKYKSCSSLNAVFSKRENTVGHKSNINEFKVIETTWWKCGTTIELSRKWKEILENKKILADWTMCSWMNSESQRGQKGNLKCHKMS